MVPGTHDKSKTYDAGDNKLIDLIIEVVDENSFFQSKLDIDELGKK